jgi:hypothetical protein
MYGQVWAYGEVPAHRFTAKAILRGALHMRGSVLQVGHDEQIFDGAVWDNWGFGVPILQVPFQALASALNFRSGFFPDRAIYFSYLAIAQPLVWAGFDRLLRPRSDAGRGSDLTLSLAATWLVLSCAVYPLMSTRFIIYEETIAYCLLFELVAIAAYIRSLESDEMAPVCAMAAGSGMALVVRPTALVYLGVLGATVLLERRWKRTLVFSAVAAPFFLFWAWSSWLRTGSVGGVGLNNSNPFFEYHTAMQRFGPVCADSPLHALQAAARLFTAFFFFVSKPTSGSWMQACHFDFDERDNIGDPFLGPAVLLLLGWMLYRLVARREGRIAAYLPYAAFVVLFASFARASAGFSWRYVGDFWPAVVLATVHHLRMDPAASVSVPSPRLAKTFFWVGLAVFGRYLVPWEWNTRAHVVPPSGIATMAKEFEASWPPDAPIPPRLSCVDRPIVGPVPYHQGLGWREGCRVGTATNFYLGVPPTESDSYALRFVTEGMAPPRLRVYLNGHYYVATKTGDEYRTEVRIPFRSLVSPIVMGTVEWVHGLEPPSGRLLSIELEGTSSFRDGSPREPARSAPGSPWAG